MGISPKMTLKGYTIDRPSPMTMKRRHTVADIGSEERDTAQFVLQNGCVAVAFVFQAEIATLGE